jgi:exonuclease SbcC
VIPVRLEMRDFLSYASPDPIDFTRFDIACLSGDNGAGKTAILDAITYALFAAARGCEDGRNQEALIREGADELTVSFTFELNNETYRIVRRRRRPKNNERAAKGNEVQFQAMTSDGWTNIAKNTIRDTDKHIEHVLRMDYNTFVNSAFFLQGRADTFLSGMTPAERRDVFAKLLDLGTYEVLESAARERSRAAERTRSELAAQAERLTEGAPDPEAIQAELDDATSHAETLRAELLEAETRLDEARAQLGELEKQAAVLNAQRRDLNDFERAHDEAGADVAARRKELHDIDTLLARQSEVSEAMEEIERLRAADAQAREHATRAANLQTELSTLTERVRNERSSIESRMAARKKIGIDLAKEKKTLETAQQELDATLAVLAESEGVDAAIDDVARQLDEERGREAAARELAAACTARLAEVHEKLELLKAQGAECPLCGGPLDAAHRRDITKTLKSSATALTADRKRAEDDREQIVKEVRRLSEEWDRLVSVQRDRSRREGSIDGLRAKCERAVAITAELEQLAVEHKADEALLEDDAYAAQWRRDIESLTVQISELYDPDAHRVLTGRLEALRSVEQLHGRLSAAAERRPDVAAELARAEERESAARDAVAARRESIAALEAGLAGLETARTAVAEATERVAGHRHQAGAADTAVERLGAQLEAALRRAADIADARAAETEAAAVHRRYDMLTQAFGRFGIPDRIIGNALPELRDEANDILGRLTDHDMSLDFSLTKATKTTGRVRETFDVLVYHDGGVRDFRMFSGGEALRIAFAVRLGLSKLLVRRAGARLETLVIDEGFGTQDPTGRERLIEAIELARREFSKVLVITHLDELKDVFGAQIRVSKDPVEGSRLQNCF